MVKVNWDWSAAGQDFGYVRGLTHQPPSLFDFIDCYSVFENYDQSIDRSKAEYEWARGFLMGYQKAELVKVDKKWETLLPMDWAQPGFRHFVVTSYGARLILRVFKLFATQSPPPTLYYFDEPVLQRYTLKTRDDYYFHLEGRKASGPYASENIAIDAGYEYLKHLGFTANQRFSS